MRRLAAAGCALLAAATIAIATNGPTVFAASGWVNTTGNLAYKLSECGTLTLLAAAPQSKTIFAGVAGRGLWSNDEGTTWRRIDDGPGSEGIANRPTTIVFDP